MYRPKILTAAVTLFTFFTVTTAPAQTSTSYQYATGSDSSVSPVPTVNAFPLNLTGPATNVGGVSQAACMALDLGSDPATAQLTNLIAGKKTTTDSNDFSCKKPINCASKCKQPSSTSSCGDYYTLKKTNEAGTTYKNSQTLKQHVPKGYPDQAAEDATLKKMTTDTTDVANYLAYLQYKKDHVDDEACKSPDRRMFDSKVAAYNCLKGLLQTATANAGTQLRTAITQNLSQYGQMNTYIQQVGAQVQQIDQILGPADGGQGISQAGGDQFQGLLGMQKSLNAQMATLNTQQASAQTTLSKVTMETASNEQTLTANEMGVVSSCMKGNANAGSSDGTGSSSTTNSGSYECWLPQKGSDGSPMINAQGNPVYYLSQSCGPMEYIRSLINQSAFKNGSGVLQDATRRAKADSETGEFDAMLGSIMRDLGDYNASSSAGKLLPNVTDWNTMLAKYGPQMDELSGQTGINIRQKMTQFANTCFSEGNDWANNQKASATSSYNQEKLRITGETNDLSALLKNGIAQLNSAYSASVAVLGGAAKSINCSTTDPNLMMACYTQVRDTVQSLLEGQAGSTTSKNISGGSMTAGFSVTCQGINGCVTAFQQVRTVETQRISDAQKAKQAFVASSVSQIQSQLPAMAANVSNAEKALDQEWTSMSGILLKMGVSASNSPKKMDPEPLQQTDPTPPDTNPGPYKMPTDMSKAIAGAMNAPGLVDFTNDGLQDLTSAATDKFSKDSDDLDTKIQTYTDAFKTISDLPNSCTENDDSGGGTATVALNGSANCSMIRTACKGKLSSDGTDPNTPEDTSWVTNVLGLFSGTSTDSTAAYNKIHSEGSDDPDCANMIANCSQAVDSLGKTGLAAVQSTGNGNVSNSANVACASGKYDVKGNCLP